ncbi:MAG: hypothetical protein ACRDH0_01945 [Actinomycetota bacterium]
MHTVGLSTYGYLNVWVSAKGFDQPGIGSRGTLLSAARVRVHSSTVWVRIV